MIIKNNQKLNQKSGIQAKCSHEFLYTVFSGIFVMKSFAQFETFFLIITIFIVRIVYAKTNYHL